MKSKWFKRIGLSVIALGLGLASFLSVSTLRYWVTEMIDVSGNQIAKRLENTKYGDRFYLLIDSEYGVMEIPVSYNLYLSSSNDEQHSFRIKLKTADYALEDTSILQEAYPFLKYIELIIFFWVASGIALLFTLLSWAVSFNQWLGLDLGLMLIGIILGLAI